MKKLFTALPLFLLLTYSCKEESNEDSTSPKMEVETTTEDTTPSENFSIIGIWEMYDTGEPGWHPCWSNVVIQWNNDLTASRTMPILSNFDDLKGGGCQFDFETENGTWKKTAPNYYQFTYESNGRILNEKVIFTSSSTLYIETSKDKHQFRRAR